MPKGGVLTLSARTSGPAEAPPVVVISVSDNGVGMAADALDRIFQPFHGGFAKGSGLGLAIVHRIVSDRGGEIRVSSAGGEGHHHRGPLARRTRAWRSGARRGSAARRSGQLTL